MRFRTNSLAFRLLASSALLLLIGLGAGAFALMEVYQDAVRREFDRRLRIVYDDLIGFSKVAQNGAITFDERPDYPLFRRGVSGWYWQIVHRERVVAHSKSLADAVFTVERPPKLNVDFHYEIDGPFGKRIRVFARQVDFEKGGGPHIYLIAGDWTGPAKSIEEFNLTIGLALGVLGIFLVGAGFIQVYFGLQPLRRIPPALAEIRTGNTDRLTGSFPAEVQPLATEINQLLDHNAQVVERARTHVGNLAHALKTPLAVLTNEAASAAAVKAGIVDAQTEIMREQVEHHLSRARLAARVGVLGARTSVMPVLEGLQRTLEKIYASRGISIAVDGPADIAFGGERQDLEDLLGNLMDNASKWAASRVRVTVRQDGEQMIVQVEDDGPGLTPSERRQAVKRGQRLDESTPGTGLGLSIVSDIAEIYGGEFALQESSMNGLMSKLVLPAV
jgi:signal transduction histidine kinase